jgi:hypothetical protein
MPEFYLEFTVVGVSTVHHDPKFVMYTRKSWWYRQKGQTELLYYFIRQLSVAHLVVCGWEVHYEGIQLL